MRKREHPIIDGLEVGDDDRPVYLHGRNCPGYCDYACNTPQGEQVADVLENLLAYFNAVESDYVLEPKNLQIDIGYLKDLRDKIIGRLKNGDE